MRWPSCVEDRRGLQYTSSAELWVVGSSLVCLKLGTQTPAFDDHLPYPILSNFANMGYSIVYPCSNRPMWLKLKSTWNHQFNWTSGGPVDESMNLHEFSTLQSQHRVTISWPSLKYPLVISHSYGKSPRLMRKLTISTGPMLQITRG